MTPLSSALGYAASAAAAAAAVATDTHDPYSAHWALYPRSYHVQRAPPGFSVDDIDGDLTKNAWKNVPFSEAFGDIQGHVSPNPTTTPFHATRTIALTQFKALYDDTHLYIGAMMHPSQDFATQAHFTKHNSPIFQLDSDFEVFIDVHGSNHNYKELEVNAINTVWNLLLDKPYSDAGHEHSGRIALPGQDDYYEVHEQKTAVQVLQGKLNDDQNHVGALWSVEMALAYTDLYNNGNQQAKPITTTFQRQQQKLGEETVVSSSSPPPSPPSPGTFWRINFSRVELQGDVNWTWQPQVIWDTKSQDYKGKIDMHLPDAWGYLVFIAEDDDSTTGGNSNDNNNHDGSSTTSSTTADTSQLRDASWPLRLTAMNIYYAQRAYRERHDGKYACCLAQLETEHLVDPNIVAPFIVTIICNNSKEEHEDKNNNMKSDNSDDSSSYTAKIQCKDDDVGGKISVEEETTTTRTTATTFTAAGFLNESNNNNSINNNDKPLYATVTQERLLQVVWSKSNSSRGGGGSSSINHL